MNELNKNIIIDEMGNKDFSKTLLGLSIISIIFSIIGFFLSINSSFAGLFSNNTKVVNLIAICGTIVFVIAFSFFVFIRYKWNNINNINNIYAIQSIELNDKYKDLNYLYNELKKSRLVNSEKKRIAILLPISYGGDLHYKEEIGYAFDGIAKAQAKTIDCFDKYEIVYLNHQNDLKIAKDLILKEFNNGTQVFICTMSKICKELSNESNKEYYFGSILESVNKDKVEKIKGILLCTLATSSKIITKENLIYRFFIGSEHESTFIINDLRAKFPFKKHGNTNLTIIYNNYSEHSYAKEAVDRYEKDWKIKHKLGNVTTIPIDLDRMEDKEIIAQKAITILNDSNKIETIYKSDIIIVIAFSICSEAIINSLVYHAQNAPKEYDFINKYIVFPSIFPGIGSFIENEYGAYLSLIELIGKSNLFYSRPKKEPNPFYGEVAEYLTMASLYRVIGTLELGSVDNFHENWIKIKLPESLQVDDPKPDSNGITDPEIVVELKRLSIKKYDKICY